MDILAQMEKTITARALLAHGDSVLIALSGGPDSVALTHLLSRLRRRLNLKLHAMYVNHQIRPQAARKEEAFCRDFCRRLRVPLTFASVDIPALARQRKTGLEETGRAVRYVLFEKQAAALDCDRVALGQHADDRVETALFRLFRGTGPAGLIGMPASRGRIVRPLYEISKAEILAYLTRRRIEYCRDRSNDTRLFRRNFIRNDLLPRVRKHLNPQVDRAILNFLDTVAPEEACLDQIVDRLAQRVTKRHPTGKIELDFTLYARYDNWIWKRLVRRCLQAISGEYPPAADSVGRVMAQMVGGVSRLSLPGRVTSTRIGTVLLFSIGELCPAEQTASVGRTTLIPELGARLRVSRATGGKAAIVKVRRSDEARIDAAALTGPLRCRGVRLGDRFRPLGMTGSRKVSDLLIDRKIPASSRDEVIVLCDDHGIVWLVGIEIADRVKITTSTKKVLRAEFRPGKAVPLTTV